MAFDLPKPFSSNSSVICRGVSKTWAEGTERAHEALRDIDIEIEPGEFVVFLGPSGCGKSTLLYLVAGLEPLSSGEIWSFHERVAAPSPDRSLIFQETSLFPWLTVWQNVSFGLGIRGAEQHDAPRRRTRCPAPGGPDGCIRQAPRRAVGRHAPARRRGSGAGHAAQGAADGRAVCRARRADAQRMQDFLLDVWRDSGASILFVTHHIDEAVALADRVAVFTSRPGRIKTIVPIDLPRPRNLFSPECEKLRIELTQHLRDEVDRAFAEQEALATPA